MVALRMALVLALAAGPAYLAYSQDAAASRDQVEYGRYLVEEVAKCQDCHTQKLPTGEPDRAQWLHGGPLDFSPKQPVPHWHEKAPNITGAGSLWARWSDAGMQKYLETAVTPKGGHSDPPMPAYHFKTKDAAAIVAYLKSLP